MGDIVDHKDRQICLPSHVLQDPLFDHCYEHQKYVKSHQVHDKDGLCGSAATPLGETFPLNYNSGQRKQRNWHRSKEVDRMQAFFLVSPGCTTSGTGVFLPATAFRPPTKKSACSPVLLPERVVQALNLNVHNNNIHISPRKEFGQNESKKKREQVVTPMDNEVDRTPIDSLEKLLPEEWIY